MIYRMKVKPREEKAAARMLRRFIIIMNDGTELMVGVSSKTETPRAVVLYLHTVCGDFTQLAHMSEMFYDDNIAYVSYTRSGNDATMRFSKFNFIGRIDELQVVVRYITSTYPSADIHAMGASAGSALLIRYLGKYNARKEIKSAMLVSPGYDFMRSIQSMDILSKTYLVNKMKYTIRHLPAMKELRDVRTLDDWIRYQSGLLGYDSADAFVQECNPLYFLDKINVPTLCLSSMDDTVFVGDITKSFLDLPNRNPNVTMVTTERGGHVMFEDHGHDIAWFLRVFRDWVHLFV